MTESDRPFQQISREMMRLQCSLSPMTMETVLGIPGDSMGFYPSNNYELVRETIRKIGSKKKDAIMKARLSQTSIYHRPPITDST